MRPDEDCLLDISLAGRRVIAFVEGMSFDAFAADPAYRSARPPSISMMLPVV